MRNRAKRKAYPTGKTWMWLLNGLQQCISSNEADAAALSVDGCASFSQASLLTSIRQNEHTNTRVSIKVPEELGPRGGKCYCTGKVFAFLHR